MSVLANRTCTLANQHVYSKLLDNGAYVCKKRTICSYGCENTENYGWSLRAKFKNIGDFMHPHGWLSQAQSHKITIKYIRSKKLNVHQQFNAWHT